MDDTYLWSHDRQHLQRTLAELEVRLAKDGLAIHPEKTAILYSEEEGGGSFHIGGEDVPCKPWGTEITALGSPAVCLAAWLLLRLGRVDLAPLSSALAAGAVEHCGSADASAAGSLACGVEEDAVLTSLWRRQRGLQSVAAVVPVLDGLVAAAAAVVVVGVAGVAVLLHAVCGAISCGCCCWGCLLVCVVRLAVAEGWGADAGPCFCVCFRGWLAVGVLLYGGWYFLTRRGLWLRCWGLAWSGLLPCLCRWVEWLRWLQRWRLQV